MAVLKDNPHYAKTLIGASDLWTDAIQFETMGVRIYKGYFLKQGLPSHFKAETCEKFGV